MKRGLWQQIENETEYSISRGLSSLQQYYLILVLSEFTDHSPSTSNNMRSRERSIPAMDYIPSFMGQVVYGHERHHQCAAYGQQQLMLQVKVLAWVGYVLVQHPSPFNLSSDIPREKGYHNEGLWSSYRPLQGGRKTEARPF